MKFSFPREPKHLTRVRKSATGHGLFAMDEIPKNRFVIEYWGNLVTDDEAQKIGGRYLFELENGKTIVGTTHKNTARYANHSCRPNAEVRISGNHVFLFSTKQIKPNEEVVYNYGKEYWNAFIKPKGCLCSPCAKKNKKKNTQ
ncbi:hypothetical protein A3E97_03885 [Candidatus Uhrbacteria bacterium RIFCSPHIGHO2_12_FULL_47_12]|uniref:SET domain-containing protein n=1 Tax=Candidatus Uhrbacteria bacterium RIFCSPLOWO2_02_FULL_48_18 TaxID=1802408 RepID=A0A1F7V9I5_9BACT|nr:MAG: hypothetical protein A2839_03495 [Candidatus Uhrbacteria bacterium RIFCSPHIGHO2_01_FULL_47_10]OGL75836.1 MAG: hypothetical protein A3E97_03885 [Candidatus Uhrbacteria bacterium RIFCSPHIGHO2_12_FULL_47_12]OGL81947.1 MAG: hypothetical protein A3B20_02590 [Candidatus Uhrbacteria bacterium RIFCSPLOWO2_01_FULL_47_17]OGL87111.1 MAG: hypothetical protein A3I41_04185 [Candidatus Uhrbacteria bacterium RIFCSPLOWO2_02_FULL_48_18]OGL93674.1 MAG: hypothetical protein A3H12_03430 [Candidatus Uhrbacte